MLQPLAGSNTDNVTFSRSGSHAIDIAGRNKFIASRISWVMQLAASFGLPMVNGKTVYLGKPVNTPIPAIGSIIYGGPQTTQPVPDRTSTANEYLKFTSGHWVSSGGDATKYPIGNFRTPFSR